MKQVSVALLAACAAMSVWGQAPKVVGKFANVIGLVTISSGESLSNVVNGGAFAVGSRVVATASGGVTLKFDNGCDLTLKANESVTVDENNKCTLVAIPSGAPGASTAAGAGGTLGPALILGGTAGAVVLIGRNNNKTSGS